MQNIYLIALSVALSAIICALVDYDAFLKILFGTGNDDDDDNSGGDGGIMQPVYLPVHRSRR